MPFSSDKFLIGYSECNVKHYVNRFNLVDEFFEQNQKLELYFIFGDYDILVISPLKNVDLDLLSRQFSNFFIHRQLAAKSVSKSANYSTFSNLTKLIYDNKVTTEKQSLIGLIRLKLDERALTLGRDEIENKIIEKYSLVIQR